MRGSAKARRLASRVGDMKRRPLRCFPRRALPPGYRIAGISRSFLQGWPIAKVLIDVPRGAVSIRTIALAPLDIAIDHALVVV
jgi:hypothetical protein